MLDWLKLKAIADDKMLDWLKLKAIADDKMLDWLKLKAIADDKINVNEKLNFDLQKNRKHCGKRRKCWLPAFSPFPTMFSKAFFFGGRGVF